MRHVGAVIQLSRKRAQRLQRRLTLPVVIRALRVGYGLAAAAAALAVIEIPEPAISQDRGDEPASQAISVRRLSVVHPGRPGAAPDGVSLTLTPGEVTVLAGPSGSGKTTLINVLLGFTAASSGQVNPQPDRSRIAWVPQRPYLFAGTVAANICLGRPGAPPGEVAAAARRAALDDLPLTRQVNERGTNLSEGQRRRVAIARALLADRELLLLDEPTAGLDQDTEQRVLAALRAEAAKGKTVLIAAHHLAVLDAADQIVDLAGVPV